MELKIKRAWFSKHRKAASQRGGGEGVRLQSQEGQELCAAAASEHLIVKTSTAQQTVDLTNKDMTKDSQRFSPWFHSERDAHTYTHTHTHSAPAHERRLGVTRHTLSPEY